MKRCCKINKWGRYKVLLLVLAFCYILPLFTLVVEAKSEDLEILSDICSIKSGTKNGVTYTWMDDCCKVEGTASAPSYNDMFVSTTMLPENIIPGETYFVKCNISSPNIYFRFIWSLDSGSKMQEVLSSVKKSAFIVVPDNAIGVTIRLNVNTRRTANGSVEMPQMYRVSSEYINSNLIVNFGHFTDTEKSGVSYLWNGNCCIVNGTATAPSYDNIYNNPKKLPDGIVAGTQLNVSCNINGKNLYLRFLWYLSDGTVTQDVFSSYTSYKVISVPDEAVGVIIRLNVNSGRTVNGTIEMPILNIVEKSSDILSELIKMSDGTKAGVTYTWDEKGCSVRGTAVSASYNNLYVNENSIPPCFVPGKRYYVNCNISSLNIYFRLIWKLQDGSKVQYAYGFTNNGGDFIVPENAIGVTIRLNVNAGNTVDGYVVRPEIYQCTERYLEPRLIVSFIDDDTSNNDLIEKYYLSCKHNNIVGNYAVITSGFETGKTDPYRLLDYENDGFGMLVHCYKQSNSIAPEWFALDEPKCRVNLQTAINMMNEYGFQNFNYWITPSGIHFNWCMDMAKDLGCEALISSGNQTFNSVYAWDQYFIKRVTLSSSDDKKASKSMDGVKGCLDEAKMNGNCWIIITTHFNEWGDLTWDDSLDQNGYPIGYERFNEVVQYAKSLGFEVMSFQNAWDIYQSILQSNQLSYGLN